jgi:hypothetical protein
LASCDPNGASSVCALDAHARCEPGNDYQVASADVGKERGTSSSFDGHHAEGKVGLHLYEGCRSKEVSRGYSHDCDRVAINESDFVDNPGIAVKACFPVAKAEHHHRIAGGNISFGREDQAAKIRSNAQHLEKVAGDEQGLSGPGYGVHC